MKKAIVLAGTDDHIHLIKILQSRGYYTILVDMAINTRAQPFADKFCNISTRDKEAVLELAKSENVELVITGCGDTTMPTAIYVSEKLGLTVPFSYQTTLNVTNKLLMKEKMHHAGIPTSRFKEINNFHDLKDLELRFPLIIKPSDGNGSAGIKKLNNPKELDQFTKEALDLSVAGTAIIEEYFDGMEVNIDAFIHKDQTVDIVMYGNVRKSIINENINLIFQTIIPAEISNVVYLKIKKIIEQVAIEFDLRNTPLLIQTLIKDEEVNVIEFSPRIGGASKHKTIKQFSGFDMLDALVDSFLGITVKLKTRENKNMFSRNHIYADPGVFNTVENTDLLLSEGVIEEFSQFKSSGAIIGENYASKDRVGSFLVKAPSKEMLMEKIKLAVSKIDVLDMDNNRIMRKEFYKGEII